MNPIRYLSDIPLFFNFFRKILENNYKGELEVIQNEIVKEGLILDLGCGTGHFSSQFSNENYIGVDLNCRYLKYAKQNHKKHFINCNGTNLCFKSETFNHILVIGLFHHLDDNTSLKVLREIKRVVKKNGKVVVIEDSKDVLPYNILGLLIHWLDVGNYIRERKEYSRLWFRHLKINKHYRISSGFCDYEVFVLT